MNYYIMIYVELLPIYDGYNILRYRFVACEVISLCGEKDGELPTVNLVIDAEDEVTYIFAYT